MKRLIGFAAIAITALPACAFAQATDTATGTVGVNGRVGPICILGDPSPALVDLGQMAATSGPRVGKVATIANRTVTLPASFCNFAGSVVKIDAIALTAQNTSSTQPGFARAVNYTATAAGWASSNASATTSALADGSSPNASGTGATQPLPKIADIGVTLSNFTVPGDLLLIADNQYSGSVVVTLGPAAVAQEN